MTIGQAARYALNAIPEFASKVLARSSGREIFYGFAVNRMKLADHGITNPKRAYFYKTAEAACFLIDVQWMAHIFSQFVSHRDGFHRNEDKKSLYLNVKIGTKDVDSKKVPIYERQLVPNDNPNAIYKLVKNPITWEYEREQVPAQDWLEAENLYVAKRNRPSQHSNYAIYADVEYAEGSKKPVPKRAGLTPLEYLRRYEPINAFALLCFGFASTHSVLSAVVPCFISKDSDFTVSNYMSSLASKIGGDRFFSPTQSKSSLDFVWEKADSAALAIAYGCNTFDAAKQWRASFKNQAIDPLVEGLKFFSNLSLCAFHTWTLFTKQHIRQLIIVGRGLGIALIAVEEVRKQFLDDVRKTYSLEIVENTTRRASTTRGFN